MSVIRTEEYTAENDEFSNEALDARPAQSTSTAIQSGWNAASVTKAASGDYPVELKFTEGTIQVVKFLDEDGPFAVYRQHFLTQKTEGKKSYICLGPNCPLCTKLSNPAEDKRAFTVINLSAAEGPQRQMLIASNSLYRTLHAAHFSPQGPLTKNYWALSRTGKMQQTRYNAAAVKPRDLMEDWNIDETAAEAAIASVKPYTRTDIKESTWEELEAIAASLS